MDPFIRHDDYPVLLGYPERYFMKTLSEGRWLNYWWSLRPVLFDHRVIFALFLGLWALSAAFLSVSIFSKDRNHWRAALAAAAFALAPPMMNTALWPGTLLPGMALVAGYAAVIAFGSVAARIWTLPLFVIPALMSHGSLPLLMMVMALAAPGWAGPRQLIVFVALFGAALAVGTAAIFTLNNAVHGVFGVRIDRTLKVDSMRSNLSSREDPRRDRDPWRPFR